MAVLRIARMGNPVLSRVAAPVENPSAPEIRKLAADMQEVAADPKGIDPLFIDLVERWPGGARWFEK